MAKRGLIALLILWAVLWWAPPFRSQSARVIEETPDPRKFYQPPLDEALLQQLARQHPRDGDLAVELLRTRTRKYSPLYFRRFDALINEMPDDLALRRLKLIDSTGQRLVLPFYQPYYGANANRAPTQADRDAVLKYQSQKQRAVLATQARAGAKQAPSDGFFPWMEAMALWDRDDEPALEALERAARATEFEDGTLAHSLALLRWQQTQGPVEWDRKLLQVYSVLLPHYAKMRQLQREVVWSGIARYKRGDKAGAYRRWSIALRAAGAWRRGQLGNPHSFLIGIQASEYTQRLVWISVAAELGGAAGQSPKQKLAAFVALARRDGQGALADYALAESADFQSDKIMPSEPYQTVWQEAYQDAMGLRRASTRWQLQLPWTSRNVLWLSVAGALGLALCLPVRWLEARLGRQWLGAVSAGQVAFFGALWAGALGLASWKRRGPDWINVGGDEPGGAPFGALINGFDDARIFWGAIAAMLVLSVVLSYAQRAIESRRLRDQTLKPHARPQPIALCALFFWGISIGLIVPLALLNKSAPEWMNIWWIWLLTTIAALALTLVLAERRSPAPAARVRSRLWLASLGCAGIAVGALLLRETGERWVGISGIAVPLLTVIIVSSALWAVGLPIYLAASDKVWRAPFARYLGVALQTLGGVALVCTVVLLLASLAALPIRARQNRIVDDYIARGEVDWIRAQPSIRNASANTSP